MRVIELTRGQVAIVDDDDFDRVAQYKWQYIKSVKSDNGYATRMAYMGYREKRKVILMHRFIINASSNMEVDHKNNNGLDNRKENLRLATTSQNRFNRKTLSNNTSGVKGVIVDPEYPNKFVARISSNGKNKYLGRFTDIEKAREAYNNAALQLHGEFVNLN